MGAAAVGRRDAAWRAPLKGEGPRAWRGLFCCWRPALAALIVGNVLGASRINLLAPPVLGLLLWNLVVYLLLLFAAGRGPSAWLALALEDARTRLSARATRAPLLARRARASRPSGGGHPGVQQSRVAAVMHAAAALLA